MSCIRTRMLALTTFAILSATPAARAYPPGDDKVENPEYVGWSRFKPGTVAVWKTVATDGDSKTEVITTRKLIEVTDSRVVLEVTTTTRKDGGPESIKIREINVARLVSAAQARPFHDPIGKIDEGAGAIKLAGTSYDARWVASRTKGSDGETWTKIWTADKAPGALLRKETIVSGGKNTTIELVELRPPGKSKSKSKEKDSGATASAAGTGSGSSGGWLTDYAKAVRQAQRDKKMLLLDFTGSDWCIWCKKLDEEVFAKRQFKKWAGEKFVLVKLDFPRRAKLTPAVQKQNEKLARRYGVNGFPTILVLDANERMIARLGYAKGGPDAWIELAEKSIEEATDED
jgi:hypothetical protein